MNLAGLFTPTPEHGELAAESGRLAGRSCGEHAVPAWCARTSTTTISR
ncbi:hypothetical protein NKG05_29820 [Oerskovia sp. M15]